MSTRLAAAAAALLCACSSPYGTDPVPGPCAGVQVDDGNACTVDACNPATGAVSHAPVEIDDLVACTVDVCDPVTGLVTHVPDDAACAAPQVCSAAVGCHLVAATCADLTPVAGTAFQLRTVVATGLVQPVHVAAPAGDAARLFAVEQPGRIRVVRAGQLLATPYLDLTDRVLSGGERGLLSVAFHPGFTSNGKLYVFYTQVTGDLRISEFTAPDPGADTADPASETILLPIGHGFASNHNGGQLAFGPDGLLYAGVGDGGGAGDPLNSGQTTTTLLGKLLRFDVASPGTPVAGNPFGNAIYDYGLRNPWRFSFDRLSGDLYVGDVGQASWEEIDFKAAPAAGQAPPPGTNWGWKVMEGAHCFSPAAGCVQAGLSLPIVEYSHVEGVSVTGGHVYRGVVMPDLAATGTYFYADFGSGFVRTFRVVGGLPVDPQDVTATLGVAVGSVSSFGEDGCGELYVVSYGGAIHKLVPKP